MAFRPCAGQDCEEYVATADDIFSRSYQTEQRTIDLLQSRTRLPRRSIDFGPDDVEAEVDSVVGPDADEPLPEEQPRGLVEVTTTHKVGAVLAVAASVVGTGGSFVVASRQKGIAAPIFWGSLTLAGTGIVVFGIAKATGLNKEVLDQWRANHQLGSGVAGASLYGLRALQPARALYGR